MKSKEKTEIIKKLLKDPKSQAIIKLTFWLIFITIVIIYTKSQNTPYNYEEKSVKKDLQYIENYEFTYKLNDQIINGEAYNDKILFYKDNNRYYYNQKAYLIDDNPQIVENYDLGILKINPQFINKLIQNQQESKQYLIPLNNFIDLYEVNSNIDKTKSSNYNIIITIYKQSSTIKKITLDLTNYNLLKTQDQTPYILNIYYYNINNVSNFTKEYENIIGGIK